MSPFTPSNLLCLKYRVKRLAQASGPAPFVFLGDENHGGAGRVCLAQQGTKKKGEAAELAFMLKAVSLGFGVAKPWGDSERYDFILDTGTRLWRVQVKSSSALQNGGYCVNAQRHANGNSIAYRIGEIDFLIAADRAGRLLVCDSAESDPATEEFTDLSGEGSAKGAVRKVSGGVALD